MWHKKVLILLLINFVFLINGCSYTVSMTKSDNNKTDSVDKISSIEKKDTIIAENNENTNVNENELKDLIMKFMTAIKNDDSMTFKELIDTDGIFAVTYFTDQRDPNRVIHVFKDEIGDDLVLVNSQNKVGITLISMFAGNGGLQQNDILINTSQVLSNISFNVDWKSKDEDAVAKQIEDIINTCQKINLTNNKNIPQVFVLRDNIYAFAQSSGILEPEPEFTGDWAIFEKTDEYYLRAVMQLQ